MSHRHALFLAALLLLATSCREELRPYNGGVVLRPSDVSTGPSPTLQLEFLLENGASWLSQEDRALIAESAALSTGGTPVELFVSASYDTSPTMALLAFEPTTPLEARWYTFEIDIPGELLYLDVSQTPQRHDATADHYASRFFAGSLPLLVATIEVAGGNPDVHLVGVGATERIQLDAGLQLADVVHVRASGVPVTCTLADPRWAANSLWNASTAIFACTGITDHDVVDVVVDRGLRSPTGVELRDFEGRSGPATVTLAVGQHLSTREPSPAVLAIGAM